MDLQTESSLHQRTGLGPAAPAMSNMEMMPMVDLISMACTHDFLGRPHKYQPVGQLTRELLRLHAHTT